MLQAIELETVIPADGKLPEAFRQFFGRKARVIVLAPEPVDVAEKSKDDSERLMQFAGTLNWPMDDPVEWQRQQRSEWDREWDR